MLCIKLYHQFVEVFFEMFQVHLGLGTFMASSVAAGAIQGVLLAANEAQSPCASILPGISCFFAAFGVDCRVSRFLFLASLETP